MAAVLLVALFIAAAPKLFTTVTLEVVTFVKSEVTIL